MSRSKKKQNKTKKKESVNVATSEAPANQAVSSPNDSINTITQLHVLRQLRSRQLRSNAQYQTLPQKSSRTKLLQMITSFQPFRFLDLPLEIRLMIYDLVVGGNQRIQMDCRLTHLRKNTQDSSASGGTTVTPRTAFKCPTLSHRAITSSHPIMIISHDFHTGKQQFAEDLCSTAKQCILEQDKVCTEYTQDLALLRACWQIYNEARPVHYRNTFVFSNLDTFAAYFGFVAPDQLDVPRSTEPLRLRAIQAMTKVEVHGAVGGAHFLDFLPTTRLIRAGLGCLTSLTSFELSLEMSDSINYREQWKIDDCLFSKPDSLRSLVVGVQYTFDKGANVIDEDAVFIAEEFMHRLVKSEGFDDTLGFFWRNKVIDTSIPLPPKTPITDSEEIRRILGRTG